MANIDAAKKAIKQTKRRAAINKIRRSRIRTFIKKVEAAVNVGDAKLAREAFKALEPELMRGVNKNIFKKNTAARKLRRLASKIRKVETQAAA